LVRFRPLVAEDRGLLLAGFAALSSRSRRARFLRGVSDAQFERMLPVLLDTVDQQSHIALLLYAEGRPIGVGRLRRFASDPGVADLAVTVADEWHGRGAGAALARELLVHAGNVREIQTVVSQDNPASLRMLARLGELQSDCAGGSCEVVVRMSRSRSITTRGCRLITGPVRHRCLEGGTCEPTDEEIGSGWMTTRDAEVFGVLARG
jgi:acetyltransferase